MNLASQEENPEESSKKNEFPPRPYADNPYRDPEELTSYLRIRLGITFDTFLADSSLPGAQCKEALKVGSNIAACLTHPDFLKHLDTYVDAAFHAKGIITMTYIPPVDVIFKDFDDPRKRIILEVPQGYLCYNSHTGTYSLSIQDYYDPDKTLHIFDGCVIITTNN